MLTNRIEIVSSGRFFSHHDRAIVYFDSRHRVTKTKLEGGLMGELVEELQPQAIFTSSDWPKAVVSTPVGDGEWDRRG